MTLVDVHLNWLNWFHFLIFDGDLLVIMIDCMILSVTIPALHEKKILKKERKEEKKKIKLTPMIR